ncbi:TlyA family rRNA (cytidine-2'-O)-methyltransferase [Verrucomicrobia bacterium LW23]|nr:TlyA family rRNA (cytidine-2'-O)-methyltransferase [Verrucomicrobia bacterium LW23]
MNQPRPRTRLDLLLVERGLFESREKAQRSIMAGEVWVDGERKDKPGTACASFAQVEVRAAADKYVSRGGYKLEGALQAFGIRPAGWRCIDVGSSTGGFTDCLLQNGAVSVAAVDVGHGQLHWKLRQDARVELHEGVNARDLGGLEGLGSFQLAVADLSFISLKLVLPAVFPLLSAPGHVIALIKPQFEVGKGKVGKGGVVRDESLHQEVIDDLTAWLPTVAAASAPISGTSRSQQLTTAGVVPSPILGREGNKEFLWWITKV